MSEQPANPPSPRQRPAPRVLAAAGALLAGAGVALSAYASHGVQGAEQFSLLVAAAMAFGHGVALAALALVVSGRLARTALHGLVLGAVLFCGGIVAGVSFGAGGGVAPYGGALLILSWLLLAVASLRGR